VSGVGIPAQFAPPPFIFAPPPFATAGAAVQYADPVAAAGTATTTTTATATAYPPMTQEQIFQQQLYEQQMYEHYQQMQFAQRQGLDPQQVYGWYDGQPVVDVRTIEKKGKQGKTKGRQQEKETKGKRKQQHEKDAKDEKKEKKEKKEGKKEAPERLFKAKGKAVKIAGLCEQAASLTADLCSGKYECMVCMDRIGAKAHVWSCSGCYAIFHIRCITTWSSKSLTENGSWACPACRTPFSKKPTARCFCGKQRPSSSNNGYLVPHSCGEVCRRKREGTSCPHTCTAVCHPGPCAPCPSIGPKRKCHCGKTTYRLRCGVDDEGKSCERPCGRKLNCGIHACEELCHVGKCAPCPRMEAQRCYCAKREEQRSCGSGTPVEGEAGLFSCQQPCGSMLSCGNHVCKRPCHAGECEPCATGLHLQSCPCGGELLSALAERKGVQPRRSCLDPVLTCERRCSKPLPCGEHTCKAVCHLGPCGPCDETVKRPCRCGSSVQQVACRDLQGDSGGGPVEVTCERRCNVLRACGRHRCATTCCPLMNMGKEAHPCALPCPKMLSCGVHRCNQGCHKGRCPRCHEASFDELVCPCGRTVMYPPILCGTEPPICPHPCTREHACSHEVKHNCHFEDECPKCVVLVQRHCAGGHELLTVPCSMTDPSCGKPCGKPLCCVIHVCRRTCHAGQCEEEIAPPVIAGDSCGYPCGAELLSCAHPCAQPCHPDKPCPSVKCQAEVYVMCPCRRRVDRGLCLRGGPDGDEEEGGSGAYIRLECDEQCAVQKRVQQLANAFGRDSRKASGVPGVCPGTTSEQQRQPTFPSLLVDAASTMPKFLRKIEGAFEELIASTAHEYQFEPMTRIYRQMVVDLADVYRLEATVVDDEPTRSVVVSRTSQSKPPTERLSEVILRNPVPRLPGTGPGLLPDRSKLYALHVYELNHSVRTEHLEQLLLRRFEGEYLIQWLDDENCVVFFNDEATMQAALLGSSSTLFKVRPLFDDDSSMFQDSLHALRWKSERQLQMEKGRQQRPTALRDPGDEEWPDASPVSEFAKETSGSLPSAAVARGARAALSEESYGTGDVEKIDFSTVDLSKPAVPLSENRFAALLKKKAREQEEVVDDWTQLAEDGGDTVLFKAAGDAEEEERERDVKNEEPVEDAEEKDEKEEEKDEVIAEEAKVDEEKAERDEKKETSAEVAESEEKS